MCKESFLHNCEILDIRNEIKEQLHKAQYAVYNKHVYKNNVKHVEMHYLLLIPLILVNFCTEWT